jgi:hypothetical protein
MQERKYRPGGCGGLMQRTASELTGIVGTTVAPKRARSGRSAVVRKHCPWMWTCSTKQVFASLEELGKRMEWRKARHTKRRV